MNNYILYLKSWLTDQYTFTTKFMNQLLLFNMYYIVLHLPKYIK